MHELVTPEVSWLDLGCGRRLVPGWLPRADETERKLITKAGLSVGVDLDDHSLAANVSIAHRLLARGDQLPFADGSFSLITANMVVEHLEDPSVVLAEVCRVLTPGGAFVIHTPNVLNPLTLLAIPLSQWVKNLLAKFLENRMAQDIFPTYYRLNRSTAIRRVAEDRGFEIDQLSMTESSPQTVMLGPLMVIEMGFIRLCRQRMFQGLRSNMIVVLRKPVAIGGPIGLQPSRRTDKTQLMSQLATATTQDQPKKAA